MIFNETKYVEKMLKNGFITDRYYSELKLLAKYYDKKENLTEGVIKDKIKEFCKKYLPKYNEIKHLDIILKSVKFGINKNNIIIDIEPVNIYKEEIDVISELKDINMEKLLFSLLVLSKAYKLIPKKSKKTKKFYDKNGKIISKERIKDDRFYVWNISEAYKLSLFKGNKAFRKETLTSFQKLKLIKYTELGSIRIDFAKTNDFENYEVIATIKSYKRLDLEYEKILGGNIEYCECDAPFIKKSNNKKYCNECSKEKKKESKLETWHNNKDKYRPARQVENSENPCE